MLNIRDKRFYIIVLIAVGFLVYAFNLNNQLFWDDDEWIKGNVFVHDFSHLKEIFTQNILSGFGLNSNYYRPLLLISFAFNYVIHGTKPFGYHLLSNLLHIGNAVLIFLILNWVLNSHGRIRPVGKSLTSNGASIVEGQRPEARFSHAAFLAALLFLIHPLQTEAVTYISGRGDPMSVFFMLLALWFFLKNYLVSYLVSSQDTRRGWLAASLFSMVLAILSRETAILLPALLMVFYISFLSGRGFWKSIGESFLKLLPYWGIAVVYGILRLTVLNFKNTLNFFSETNIYTQHLSYRLYSFGHALVEYFKLIFVPVGLHMERDLPVSTSLFQWPVPIAVLIVITVIFIAIIFYQKERRPSLVKFPIPNSQFPIKSQIPNSQTNPNYQDFKQNWKLEIENWKFPKISDFRVWLFAWGWFAVTMLPVSGIIPINAIMYEHWLYLPLVGLFALAGFYLDKLFQFLKLKNSTIGYWLLAIGLTGYFSFFAVASIKRNIAWGKPLQFYEDILKYTPNSVRILNNLGNLYSGAGDLDKAANAYERAIASPDGNIFAQPHYNLGNIYRDRGDIEKAIQEYKNAIVVDPKFPFAYQNLAVIYANRGELTEAALMLEKVKELRPLEPRVYYNLALIYLGQNKKDLALKNLQDGLKFSAGDPQVDAEVKRLLEMLGE